MDIQILVVEDDESINDMVKKILMAESYNINVCFDEDEALEQFYKKNY